MEKILYEVAISYMDSEGKEYTETNYMKLTKGEKELLYWLEDKFIVASVDIHAVDEVEIVEF